MIKNYCLLFLIYFCLIYHNSKIHTSITFYHLNHILNNLATLEKIEIYNPKNKTKSTFLLAIPIVVCCIGDNL
jgi:hypothetical protein